jgi:ubiquinone/menaquinone biosynthesis C-methylase UbiE
VRALTLALSVLAASLSAQSPAPDKATLERRLADSEARGDWNGALQAATLLNDQAEEQHSEALYRLARLHALLGHTDRAYHFLERLNQSGLFDVTRLRGDTAFDALRTEERFRTIAQTMWLKGYLWILERPERDEYQQPARVMQVLAFRAGERVADIGAGSGYFTRRIAAAVGPTGTVWAIDLRPELLSVIEERARKDHLANIRLQKVTPDDPQLPSGGVDTILMVDTLHYIKDRAAYARKLRDGLAPAGRVVIIDFIPKPLEDRPWGPPPEQKMTRDEVDAAMAAAGLVPARVHAFLTEQFFVEYVRR